MTNSTNLHHMVPATHKTLTHNTQMNSPRTSTNAARPDIELAEMGISAQQSPCLALPRRTVSRPKQSTRSPVLVTPRLNKGSKLDLGSTDYNPFSKNYTNPFDAGWTRPSSRPTRTQSPDTLPVYNPTADDKSSPRTAEHAIDIADVERLVTPTIVEHSGNNDADPEALSHGTAQLPPRRPRPSRKSRTVSWVKARLTYHTICWTLVCLIHAAWFVSSFIINGLPEEDFSSAGGDRGRMLLWTFSLTCFLLGLWAEALVLVAYDLGKRASNGQTSRMRPWLATTVVVVPALWAPLLLWIYGSLH